MNIDFGDVSPFNKWFIGDYYIDCALHLCIVTGVSHWGDCSEYGMAHNGEEEGLEGVSLFDGSNPRSCSIRACAPIRVDTKMMYDIMEGYMSVQDRVNRVHEMLSSEKYANFSGWKWLPGDMFIPRIESQTKYMFVKYLDDEILAWDLIEGGLGGWTKFSDTNELIRISAEEAF